MVADRHGLVAERVIELQVGQPEVLVVPERALEHIACVEQQLVAALAADRVDQRLAPRDTAVDRRHRRATCHRLDPRMVVVGVDDADPECLRAGGVGEIEPDAEPRDRTATYRHVLDKRTP